MAPTLKRTRSMIRKQEERLRKRPGTSHGRRPDLKPSRNKRQSSLPPAAAPSKKSSKKSKATAKATEERSSNISDQTAGPSKHPAPQKVSNLESFLFPKITTKQRNGFTKEFREKIDKLEKAISGLLDARKEFDEVDRKVYHLEETYGRTMKIQDLWQYQERSGLASIIGLDPQQVMNASHLFQDSERLIYNSQYPRNPTTSSTSTFTKSEPQGSASVRVEVKEEEDDPMEASTSSSSPPRTRTRAQQEALFKQFEDAHKARSHQTLRRSQRHSSSNH